MTNQQLPHQAQWRWANEHGSGSARLIYWFAVLGALACVIAAPFTMGASLLVLVFALPLEFALARMVREQCKQTKLLMLLVKPDHNPNDVSYPIEE